MLVLGVILVLTVRWFIAPAASPPDRADAVVVLLGGHGERLERGLEVMDDGVADTLVLEIDDWPWREWRAVMPFCLEEVAEELDVDFAYGFDYEIVCIVPDPTTTRGEARTISALAEERGWESLAVVTSDYHVHRARIHFERCFGGTVHPVAADAPFSPNQLAREWGGTLQAQLTDRSC